MSRLREDLTQHTKDHLAGDPRAIKKVAELLMGLFRTNVSRRALAEWERTRKGIKTVYGEAINPLAAVACLDDHPRTGVFLNGANKAVKSLPKDREVQLAEVGSGPIAPMALCTSLVHPNVKCTAIDISEESIDILTKILRTLEIDLDRFTVHQQDATQGEWRYAKPDLVVAETLDAGLLHEPYGAITAHLAPQFASTTIWIPDCVEVRAYLRVSPKKEKHLGVVTRVDDTYRVRAAGRSIEEMITVKTSLPLPPVRRPSVQAVTLHTGIRVFSGVCLRDSVLNREVELVGGVLPSDTSIDIEYSMGDKLGAVFNTKI